jgi:hypothetical protein
LMKADESQAVAACVAASVVAGAISPGTGGLSVAGAAGASTAWRGCSSAKSRAGAGVGAEEPPGQSAALPSAAAAVAAVAAIVDGAWAWTDRGAKAAVAAGLEGGGPRLTGCGSGERAGGPEGGDADLSCWRRRLCAARQRGATASAGLTRGL